MGQQCSKSIKVITKIHTSYNTEVTSGVEEWDMGRGKDLKDLGCCWNILLLSWGGKKDQGTYGKMLPLLKMDNKYTSVCCITPCFSAHLKAFKIIHKLWWKYSKDCLKSKAICLLCCFVTALFPPLTGCCFLKMPVIWINIKQKCQTRSKPEKLYFPGVRFLAVIPGKLHTDLDQRKSLLNASPFYI